MGIILKRKWKSRGYPGLDYLKGRRNSIGRVENIYEGVLLVLDIDGSLLLRIISEVVN